MLISGGNLIKKVLFPAEILPIVSVLANMVHFFFGLPILAGFLLYYHRPLHAGELAIFPLAVLVQLVLTMGFALILSALTVHFRDIRDILSNLLTFWFFATPIIYPYFIFDDPKNPGHTLWQGQALKLNPFTHLADHVSGNPVLRRPRRALAAAPSPRPALGRVLPVRVLCFRQAARHVCGGG